MEVDDQEKHIIEALRQVQENGGTIEVVTNQTIIARLVSVHNAKRQLL